MTTSNQVELLPCPFCGSTQDAPIERVVHLTFDEESSHPYGVQCDGCCAFVGSTETEDEAVAAWNTRSLATIRDTDEDAAARMLLPFLSDDMTFASARELIGEIANCLRLASSTPAEPDEPLLSSLRTWITGLPHDMESRPTVLADIDKAMSQRKAEPDTKGGKA